MEMRSARTLGMCGLVIVALGCGKVSKDNTKVLANVGGEKVTEKSFGDAVRVLVGDDAKANDLLTNPATREQRNRFLSEYVDQKMLAKYGEKQGLDKDPKAKMMVEAAKANAYGQILLERRIAKGEPTEAQLKAFYDKFAAKAKAEGHDQGFPPYEAVKAQLPQAWKAEQAKTASQGLLDEARAQVPTTVDPMWKAEMPK